MINIPGLRWHRVQDTLYLAPKQMASPPSQPTSKRDVLQLASKTYDPLGLISYLQSDTVKAKLLIQELWQRKLEWDEPLSTELEAKWDNIGQDIQEAIKLVLLRFFFSQMHYKAQPIYLYVFADTSPKAYGTVAYIFNGDQSSLVMSKSGVAHYPLRSTRRQAKISQPFSSSVVRQRESSPLVRQRKAPQTVYCQPNQRDQGSVPCYCLESLSNQ